MSKSLQALSASINNISVAIAQKKGVRERIEQQCSNLKTKIDEESELNKTKKDAYLLILAFISQRRESAIQSIESTATYALKAVCGDDYRVHFLRNEDKKNAAAFKMEIGIESNFNDSKLITGLKDERGGGVAEPCSFGLRIAALEWLGYDGPIILDEAYKSVSNDKIVNVAKLLKTYVKSTNRQIIYTTHKGDVFEEYADHVIQVHKENGISKIIKT